MDSQSLPILVLTGQGSGTSTREVWKIVISLIGKICGDPNPISRYPMTRPGRSKTVTERNGPPGQGVSGEETEALRYTW